MAFNRLANRVIKQDLAEEARLNFMSDAIPDIIGTHIQPVIIIGKKYCDVVRDVTVSTSGGASTIYTTPTDKDFYLVSATIGVAKTVLCDTATARYSISVVIQGTTRAVLAVPLATLTASSQVATLTFNPPIKVDRGTIISSGTPTFTAGELNRNVSIVGYISDTSTAGA